MVQRTLAVRRHRQRVWLERWIREGYSVRQLSQQSGQPSMRLRRIIEYWLSYPPAVFPDLSRYRHLIVDTTYLCGRRWPLTVFMDAVANTVITGELGVHEAASVMGPYCAHLARQGLNPFSITTDGQPRLLESLRQCWPQTILQRCLVHIQRQGLMWCRRRPTRADAQHLWRLFQKLTAIRTPVARDRWIDQLIAWEQR